MDFFVYDNVYTFNKAFPAQKHEPLSRLKIKQIAITVQGAFWFETDMNREDHNVNVNQRYLHLHKGIQSMSKMQFDKEPRFIHMQDIIYNPKNKCIEIYSPGKIWPWSKPIFTKNVAGRYYGASIPNKKMKILGDWFFDYHNNRIFAIMNYYPGYKNLQFKD